MSPRYYGHAAVEEGPPPPDPGDLDVTVDATTLVTGTINGKDWHGRASVVTRDDGVKVLFYRSGSKHEVNDGALHVRFSDDHGATWTDEDTKLGGGAVTGFPMNPSTLSAGEDAGEPWAIIAPSGDILLFMWRVDYFVTKGGTWMSRSEDGGETWSSSAGPIEFAWFDATSDTQLRTYATDDGFVLGTDIYMAARIYTSTAQTAANFVLMKSSDDGETWSRVEYIVHVAEAGGHGCMEAGLERIGATSMIAMLRDCDAQHSYKRVSTDLGATWGTLGDMNASVGIAGRQRVYTVDHLRGEENWWLDPRLIMTGFVLQTPGSSQGRRNAVWISLDSGASWSEPFYIDTTSDDGGYGDIFWDPEEEQFVVVSYKGTLASADLIQYRLTISGLD